MFCKYCGGMIADDSVFCKYCGKQLTVGSNNDGDDKVNLVRSIACNKIIIAVVIIIAIFLFVIFIREKPSLVGTWYCVYRNEGNLNSEICFNSDGGFRDGSVGATYSADNGELIIYYNSLAGSYTYEYSIKEGKLHLYRKGDLKYIYSKNKNDVQ